MSDILEIRMQSNETECFICGAETEHCWGVPTCNGDIVSNDFPDDLWDGGVPVCEDCYLKHERGEIPTCDRFYLPRGRSFINGDGI